MRIAMVGSGYVGLVSGTCFADFGHSLVCVDPDAGKIDLLKAGRMPIYEPGLDALVADNVRHGRLGFSTKITFINGIADLGEQVGANGQQVARGIGLDNRIGAKFLHAGPGYGGSCFPKDTLALVKTAQDAGTPVRLVETVVAVNDQRKRAMARKVVAACGGSVRGKCIAILGLTFKPNTDDMRDAPALSIITGLQDGGATIRAYDPEGMEAARPFLSDVTYTADAYDCAEGADAVVIVTEWNAFRALDLGRLRAAMATPVMVDLRNVYTATDLARAGFAYTGIGQSRDQPMPPEAGENRPIAQGR